MKISRTIALSAAAVGITFGVVATPTIAMAAPQTDHQQTSVSAGQDIKFGYAVTIHFTNHTDRPIFIGPYQTEVPPRETRVISNGSTFGVDIDSNFSYGSKDAHHYGVRAKNPSIGTPWIDIAGSGERKLDEGQGFYHEFDGHRVDVNRGGDTSSANGYKHFNVDVRS